jgi:hypothetical protein
MRIFATGGMDLEEPRRIATSREGLQPDCNAPEID